MKIFFPDRWLVLLDFSEFQSSNQKVGLIFHEKDALATLDDQEVNDLLNKFKSQWGEEFQVEFFQHVQQAQSLLQLPETIQHYLENSAIQEIQTKRTQKQISYLLTNQVELSINFQQEPTCIQLKHRDEVLVEHISAQYLYPLLMQLFQQTVEKGEITFEMLLGQLATEMADFLPMDSFPRM